MAQKIKILAISSDVFGCGQLRIIQPYKHLAENNNNNPQSPFLFHIFSPNKNQGVSLDMLDNYDCIVFQRILDENGIRMIDHAKKRGKVVIQEMDDNILHISSNNPFFHATHKSQYRKHFKQGVLMCDYMHVTVPEISESYQKEIGLKPSQYKVFPNAVFRQHPKLLPFCNRRKELPLDKIVFGFQGGSSHKDDLEVMPPIFPILDEIPNAIFAFCSDIHSFNHKWGNIPLKYRNRVIYIQPVTDSYDNFPNLPSMYDLGIVPLLDSTFNQSKSHLKILEFAVWDVPTVTSIIPDYQRFADISKNANILIKKNKVKLWHENIIRLLKDKEMRIDLGQRAKRAALEHFSLEVVNAQRIEFFKGVFNV